MDTTVDSRPRAIDRALVRALDFLARSQLSTGEFPIYVAADPDMVMGLQRESATFPTALIMYALTFLDHPLAEHLQQKGATFLRSEMQGPGLWRYGGSGTPRWVNPDLDSTVCASLVLAGHEPIVRCGFNIKLILSCRNSAGLFYTWIRPSSYQHVVDSVVNANVICYVGERTETAAASEYLNDLLQSDREGRSHPYYIDSFALYYAVARAVNHGVERLVRCRGAIIDKVVARQQGDGSFGNPLQTAYAVCSLMNLAYHDHKVLNRAVDSMLQQQMTTGAWPRAAAWVLPDPPTSNTPTSQSLWFGSEAWTTGLSIEALARYRQLC